MQQFPTIRLAVPARLASAFDSPDWIFEMKHDGFRALVYIADGRCNLVSRKNNVYKSFAALCVELAELPVKNAVLDGEIVCLDDEGRSQFNTLLRRRGQPAFYAFDLLYLNHRDLRKLPLIQRKLRLRKLIERTKSPSVIYAQHIEKNGLDALVIEQHVRAKPSDVFADLTVPDRMVRWWGDRSKWWLTSAEVDLRPNGRFWVLWENTKGEKDGMGGHFKAIDHNRGFVLSFVGSHAKSHVDELAIRLQPEKVGTRVELRHSGLAGRPERYADSGRPETMTSF